MSVFRRGRNHWRTVACVAACSLAVLLLLIACRERAYSAPLVVAPEVLAAESKRVAVMARAREATVAIFTPNGQGGGSGVLISADGYALSNFHVSSAAGDWMKCGLADGKLYDAVIVGIDPVGDVALVKLLGRTDFPAADLADSDAVRVGDWVFCSGNPFLLATDFKPTISYGIVSGVGRYQYPDGTLLEYADCIQTDAAINPGNSGGPLFDAAGKVIGINGRGSFEKRGRVNVGVGYAISINQIKRFMGQLRAGRIVDHATLGATVASDDRGRARVDTILEESDAFRRGLRYDDVVESLAGRKVATVNAVKNVLGSYPKGWRVPLVYRRDDKRFETYVRLAGVHREAELLAVVQNALEQDSPKKPDGEKPEPKKPGDKNPEDKNPENEKPADPKPGENPPGSDPIPPELKQLLKKPEMPEAVRKFYEARRGFANYYFNRLERDRVWKAFAAKGGFGATGEVWAIAGQLADGATAAFELGPKEGVSDLPDALTRATFGDDLADVRDPPGSGGLLVALHLWQRLLRLGPERFGQVTYWGTAPLVGRSGMCDVLVATHGGVECRCYFTPEGGDLVCLEMYANEDGDPCEVYFSDYRELDGVRVPGKLEVRYGDAVFATVTVKKWALKLDKGASK